MPLEVQTVLSGAITVGKHDMFTFPCGIIGFEDTVRYCLLQRDPHRGLHVLQGRPSGVEFAVLDSRALACTYDVQVELDDLVDLEMRQGDHLQAFLLITPASIDGCSTVNLSAPLIVNMRSRIGKQVIQWQSPHNTRHLLSGEIKPIDERELSSTAARAAKVTLTFP